MNPRLLLAVWVGKLSLAVLRLFGSGGAALPGLLAQKIHPSIFQDLSRQCQEGVILICGTNGKTTTSRLLACALQRHFKRLIHNRSGSNLTRGHIAAFLEGASWLGKVGAPIAILEVDEAVLSETLNLVKPKIILLHNLFRDQLDRYGEVDSIAKKWLESLQKHSLPYTTLVVNADDPTLAYLAKKSAHKPVIFYGLEDESSGQSRPISAVDIYLSPVSGKPLTYRHYYLSHLGDYYDTHSSFRRPELDIGASVIGQQNDDQGTTLLLHRKSGNNQPIHLSLPGLYNVYNALAAASCALLIGLDPENISAAFQKVKGVFGRFERIKIKDKQLILCLVKNPVGATEVLSTIANDPHPFNLAIFANDNLADGMDISWYWDVRFEVVVQGIARLICSGKRAADMALRLKYAGFSSELSLIPDIRQALRKILESTAEKTYLLSTYTATLELQKILAKSRVKAVYWKE